MKSDSRWHASRFVRMAMSSLAFGSCLVMAGCPPDPAKDQVDNPERTCSDACQKIASNQKCGLTLAECQRQCVEILDEAPAQCQQETEDVYICLGKHAVSCTTSTQDPGIIEIGSAACATQQKALSRCEGDDPAPPSEPATCTANRSDDPCSACSKGECCEQVTEFERVGGKTLLSCIEKCGDSTSCLNACRDRMPEAWTAFLGAGGCQKKQCADECSL